MQNTDIVNNTEVKDGPILIDEPALIKEGIKEGEIDKMFEAGVHYGYSRQSRHPKTKPYIFTTKNNVEIFDLEKVEKKLKEAEEFIKNLAKQGKVILFVGTKPEAKKAVLKAAQEINMPFCVERWLGGIFTNFNIIRKRMDYFENLKETKTTDKWLKYTKKERLVFDKEIEKMERFFGGLVSLKKKPDAIVIVDAKYEKVAKEEAKKSSVPIIALMNSDNNPTGIEYPVIANDTARSSIEYFTERIIKAYQEGLALKTVESNELKNADTSATVALDETK